MKGSILIQQLLNEELSPRRTIFTTRPYQIARGVARAMQRYAVIALSSRGSDLIRPWFGTGLPAILKMNIYDKKELELLVRDELNDAIKQFFLLQSEDPPLSDGDIITSISVVKVEVSDITRISAEVLFVPRSGDAVTVSLEV